MSDWWREYQTGDTAPWDRERWPDPPPRAESAAPSSTPRRLWAVHGGRLDAVPPAPVARGGPTVTRWRDGVQVTEPLEPIQPPPPLSAIEALRLMAAFLDEELREEAQEGLNDGAR